MDNVREVDYIIVGQGLAGSALALQLIKRCKRLLVIDEPSKNRSTLQAAGLFNPVTGRKLVRTWRADELFPYLHEFYREAEELTGEKFFHPMEMYRPFVSVEEQNDWIANSADEVLGPFIANVTTMSGTIRGVRDPFGGVMLNRAGYLDTRKYIEAVRRLIREDGFFIESEFLRERLSVSPTGVRYDDFNARRIIFCQGTRNFENEWFKKIPIRPLKGEVLTIDMEANADLIVNRGVYVVPTALQGRFRVGATYAPNDLDPTTTPEARNEMEGKLASLMTLPYSLVGQDWGVRPTTPDRRPILGGFPGNDRVVIFNGLGTKGVSLAPYFSQVLVRWLENGVAIDKDADVSRYY